MVVIKCAEKKLSSAHVKLQFNNHLPNLKANTEILHPEQQPHDVASFVFYHSGAKFKLQKCWLQISHISHGMKAA